MNLPPDAASSPAQQPRVTDRAFARLAEIADLTGEDKALRVGVLGGGCSGFQYDIRLDEAAPDDLIIEKSGRKVLVIEAAVTPGGAAVAAEFAPGYRSPGLAHVANMIDPRVASGMALDRHGLAFVAENLASTAVSASGDHLVLEGAAGAVLKGNVSEADRKAWAELRRQRKERFYAIGRGGF